MVCFRCILPTCYGCTGSDDEEGETNDEGYHSNRRSSEILPQAEGGADGHADRQEVEMNEIKSDTVTPLIPPRRTPVNDYRKETGKKESRGAVGGASVHNDDTEMTYIEVESVSLSGMDISSKHIPDKSEAGDTCVKLAMDYEEPLNTGSILEERLVVSFEKALAARGYGDSADLDEISDDSESQYYVNEDVLKPKDEPMQTAALDETDSTQLKHYFNLDNVKTSSINGSHKSVDSDIGQSHEYVNLKPPEDIASESLDKENGSVHDGEPLTVKLPTRISVKSKSKKDDKKDTKSKADEKKAKSKSKKESKSKVEIKLEEKMKKEEKKAKSKESKKDSKKKVNVMSDSKESSVEKEIVEMKVGLDKSDLNPSRASSLDNSLHDVDIESDSKDSEKLIIKEADDVTPEPSNSSSCDEETEQTTDQTKLI